MTTTSDVRETVDRERLPERAPRLNLRELVPDVYKALFRLEAAVRAGLDPTIYELVKIRASQINHCAFCLDMHSKDALASGESVERLVQLSAWEESQHFYTAREVAALRLTEAITVLTEGFVPDEVYEEAAKYFDDTELAHLISSITSINAWNRLGVTARAAAGHHMPASSH
ncbi:MAG TPA: carboxymuconolactone decarboxylase family protein [Pseudonocardia sp.]|jgi:AhpD family alkylhydroperoxidase|nr:carboxymuconolactone decarboxylase family protein [Pseudonocardia sp.]